MRFTRLRLKNWKNFQSVDVPITHRMFIVGANASGKSNLIDALRFVRDLCVDDGGLQPAIRSRGGVAKIRSLHAKANEDVHVSITVIDDEENHYEYALAFTADTNGYPVITHEEASYVSAKTGKTTSFFARPGMGGNIAEDKFRRYTFIEQPIKRSNFEELVAFLASVQYIHFIPEAIRNGTLMQTNYIGPDVFGGTLLLDMKNTPPEDRNRRLSAINKFLRLAVPLFAGLSFIEADEVGRPHLEVSFSHWKQSKAYQDEIQMSDGTLRLIGILWVMQEPNCALLLEEPEVSIHTAILSQFAPFIAQAQGDDDRKQILITTHSISLLKDEGIAPEEILLVTQGDCGAQANVIANVEEAVDLLTVGLSLSDVVMPLSTPRNFEQLVFLDLYS